MEYQKYKESIKYIREMKDKYERLLKMFGFQDIEVNISYYTDDLKSGGFLGVSSLSAYFWVENQGYCLYIYFSPSLMSNSELTLMLKESCDKIFWELPLLKFIPSNVNHNFFDKYLTIRGFDNLKLFKSGKIIAFKNENQYHIDLRRVDVEGRKWEDDEPFSFDYDEIKPYQERFDNFLKKHFVHKYKLIISSDLEYISVEMDFDNNREYIAIEPYYNLLNVDNDTIENIL
jgi:hypothetical protein